jgi:hypothetical protein
MKKKMVTLVLVHHADLFEHEAVLEAILARAR